MAGTRPGVKRSAAGHPGPAGGSVSRLQENVGGARDRAMCQVDDRAATRGSAAGPSCPRRRSATHIVASTGSANGWACGEQKGQCSNGCAGDAGSPASDEATHRGPCALQTSTHVEPRWPPHTCDRVGPSAANRTASTAIHAVRRRTTPTRCMSRLYRSIDRHRGSHLRSGAPFAARWPATSNRRLGRPQRAASRQHRGCVDAGEYMRPADPQ